MIDLIEYFSYALMPILIIVVISLSLKNRISIYETFIEGAKDSFSVILSIFPSMLAILLVINLFKVSRWNGAFCEICNSNIFKH